MGRLLYYVFTTVLILAIPILFYKLVQILFGNWQPGQNKVQNDIREMRQQVREWMDTLVPWNRTEMPVLSLNKSATTVKGKFPKIIKGCYTSIYEEPMITYAFKRYMGQGENSILYLRTSEDEYIFRTKHRKTQLIINDQFVGNITEEGKLYDRATQNLLAEVSLSGGEALPVLVDKQELGAVRNPIDSDQFNARAFMYLNDFKEEDASIFTAMSLFAMTQDVRSV